MKIKLFTILAFLALASCSYSYKYTPSTSAMINVTNYEIGDTSLLKTGEACSTRILGFMPLESSTSVIDAMKNGKISKIKMIDSTTSTSPFTTKICTIVHGL